MADINSRYQRQVGVQQQAPLQMAQVKAPVNAGKQQRYEAIGFALDKLAQGTADVYMHQQDKLKEEQRKALAQQQQLDELEARRSLRNEGAVMSEWLQKPENIGKTYDDAFEVYSKSHSATFEAKTPEEQAVFDLNRRMTFEGVWLERSAVLKQEETNKRVYTLGEDFIANKEFNTKAFSELMGNQGVLDEGQGLTLLQLGAKDARIWKEMDELNIGTPEQQAKANQMYTSWKDAQGKLKAKPTFATELYKREVIESGDMEKAVEYLQSGIGQSMTATQQVSFITSTQEQANKNAIDMSVINMLSSGKVSPEDIDTIALSVQQQTVGGAAHVGRIDVGDYMTSEHKNDLINAVAYKAAQENNHRVLGGLRNSSTGIPAEINTIRTGLSTLIDTDGKTLSKDAGSVLQLLKTYQSDRGGIAQVSMLFDGDEKQAVSLILARIGNGENENTVMRDVGLKIKNGTLKFGTKNNTWDMNYTTKRTFNKKFDKLPFTQQAQARELADIFGRGGMDANKAADLAVEQAKKSNGEITSWTGTDYTIQQGSEFTNAFTVAVSNTIHNNKNEHDVLDWYVTESLKLSGREDIDNGDVSLIYNGGYLYLFTTAIDGLSEPLVQPFTPQEIANDYAEIHSKYALPKG